MNLTELPLPRQESALQELLALWELSVRVSHAFLSAQDIIQLATITRRALGEIPILYVLGNFRQTLGFMGIQGHKLEMLFLHPDERGKGYGGRMLAHAIEKLGVIHVDVNEQNPDALAFYLHKGFQIIERCPLDDCGMPWPILRLRRIGA